MTGQRLAIIVGANEPVEFVFELSFDDERGTLRGPDVRKLWHLTAGKTFDIVCDEKRLVSCAFLDGPKGDLVPFEYLREE